ncbi:2-amino-4-hydroxy-6-hydroxymethyldihydropteridine diphosphokinase [uncultured Cyclobacterium sp.]|uniref:2-amino-4-hydroxy-6- hydroxymethyldihydropteridine diphosphokinase n=1 Tax=uncultured Cyclobacterium sp. TaxID=453820 RepID=UPI0030EBDBBF|tara:strand:- start:1606 stop:2094 length:489 start_codon:yes stop_codon:yes gene_type:complete
MHQVVLGLGGNMGDRLSLLKNARKLLTQQMSLEKESLIYQTAAWGGESKTPYLNQVLVLTTNLDAIDCLDFILNIENQLGRERVIKWGDRTMDIDILYYDYEIINTERLKVPHPYMVDRNFVLVPLAEVLPDFVHPQMGKSSMVLREECEDSLKVKPWCDIS